MSKLPHPIKKQLQELQQVTLSAEVKEQQKATLFAQIETTNQPVKKEFFVKELISVYVRQWTASMTWRSIGTLFLIFGVVIGPGIATVSASRGSLPGDTLFPVKRSLEKAKISVTFSDKAKAKLEIDHVENRINELARLTKEQTPSPERKVKVFLALEELKKDTASVKGRIEKLKDESTKDTSTNKKKKKDAAEVALLVQEKTVTVQESIKTTVKDLATEGDDDGKADVKEALDSVNEVAIDALEVIVDTHEDGDSLVNQEDVKELVKKQLENTKEIVQVLKDEVDKKPEEESKDQSTEEAEETTDAENTSETDDESLETKDDSTAESTEEKTEATEEETDASEAGEQSNEDIVKQDVKKILEEDLSEDIEMIEQLIEMDNLSQAVDKLAETKTQVSEINKNLRTSAETKEQQPVEEDQENSQDSQENQEVEEQVDPEGEEATQEETDDSSETQMIDVIPVE